MDPQTYQILENHMLTQMQDAAHDPQHIYRVLKQALLISAHYPQCDQDVLIAACLLHDIGRQSQFDDPRLCHAVEGGKMAYAFLKSLGWAESKCRHVQACITTHRFRTDALPQTLEAKILFDADKLDVTGALAIARSLLYQGKMNIPLYISNPDGSPNPGTDPTDPGSFLKEYHFKLLPLYDQLFTAEARALAQARKQLLEAYYHALCAEIDLSNLPALLAENLVEA